MSNTNSVSGIALSGSLRNQFPTQAVATATETQLVVGTDTGTTPYFLVAPTGGQVYGATGGLDTNANQAITERSQMVYGLPSGESNDQFSAASWDGHPFKVRISGIGNAGAVALQTLQVNLYQGTSTTIGSDNKIGSTGTGLAAVAGGAFNFFVEATVLWDATSQIMSGAWSANIAYAATSQFTGYTTTTTAFVVTGVTAANLSFLATLKLGVAAASTITVREFTIERI